MYRLLIPGFIILSLLLVSVPAPTAERSADPLVDQVQQAIKKGKDYLILYKTEVGQNLVHWEKGTQHPGGYTSLALLALLNCGVSPNHRDIQRGLNYLRTIPPRQTYVVGLQTMVYAQAGQAVDRDRIQTNVDWLVAARSANGWSYGKGGDADNSNTQYALLGLHEGLLAGARVDPRVLKEVRDFYRDSQVQGGWGYRKTIPQPTMTMTTAGVCGLMISGMDLALGKQVLRDDGSAENCGIYDENKPVADGLNWIGSRFPARITPRTIENFGSPFYCLYGIERTGRLTGQRYFGGHDWYRLGCDYLVKIQKEEGCWYGTIAPGHHDSSPVVATSFALLFLSKGRTPILVTKFAHGPNDSMGWNNKRSDCRYLIDFVNRERLFLNDKNPVPMGWQIFDVRKMEAASAESEKELAAELLPSPVVYLNGHNLRLSDKAQHILTEYVNNGGFLFAEACCGSKTFDEDFRELMAKMFPDDDGKSRLERIPAEHPVWFASGKFAVKPGSYPESGELPVRPGQPGVWPELWGIQQGCKWVVMYSPRPLAGYWEANQYKEGRGKVAFQLGTNVLAYATGLEPPRPRLTQATLVRDNEKAPSARRGYLEVGQLAHGGDWKPAPRAMRFLMEECRKSGLDVLLSTAQVRLSNDVDLANRPNAPIKPMEAIRFFYMHGRRDFTVDRKRMEDLRFNLESGGTLFADACCGSRVFDESFRKFMKQMWAEKKLTLERIPLDDELYSKDLTGKQIETVRCRVLEPDGRRVVKTVSPALEGIKYNGRWLVIYSRYDIGCALEKHSSSECLGHDFDSAALLGKAVVLYALTH